MLLAGLLALTCLIGSATLQWLTLQTQRDLQRLQQAMDQRRVQWLANQVWLDAQWQRWSGLRQQQRAAAMALQTLQDEGERQRAQQQTQKQQWQAEVMALRERLAAQTGNQAEGHERSSTTAGLIGAQDMLPLLTQLLSRQHGFDLLPSSGGGRYRMEPDTVNDSGPGCSPGANCSAPLDTTQASTVFDVLTPLASTPAAGDAVVIGNQTPEQVYGGSNRATITQVATPNPLYGLHRISIASTQFPSGYDGGRFVVVPASQGPVFYVCSGADGSTDAQGNGRGTLVRLMGYGYNASYPSTCPSGAGGHVLASKVLSCQFVHDPNQGATQQNGFVWLQLVLARSGEQTTLAFGAHVDNAP